MGLFTSKQKTKDMTPKEVKYARSYLDKLINQYSPGQSPEFPTQQVADLTAGEQAGIDSLNQVAANGSEGYNLAMDYTKGVLGGNDDPTTSDYYRGFREEADRLKGASNADIRRQAQKGGGTTRTTPTYAAQAENSQAYDSKILQLLGSLYENERNRQGSAASQAQSLGQQKVSDTTTALQASGMKRSVEQARMDAAYQSAIQELLFPYTQQLQAIGTLFNAPQTIVQTGGGLTDLGFLTNAAAGAAGSYFQGAGAKK